MSALPREGEDPRQPAFATVPRPKAPETEAKDERKWVQSADPSALNVDPSEGVWRVHLPLARWRPTSLSLAQGLHHRLSSMWGEVGHSGPTRIHALWLNGRSCRGIHLQLDLPSDALRLPTLLPDVPPALYFEREIAEMYGVEFQGNPDRRPLLLHHLHPSPPMRPPGAGPSSERAPYGFPPTEGEGIYEIPVGPVHAGVIEPGHFRFQVRGEEILNLELRLGYTHKGTEKLFEGREASRALVLAESVSGDMSVAAAMAYASSVEAAIGLSVPFELERSRGALLEAERVAFLLGDVAGISLDVGYAAGAAQANVLRARAYGALEGLSGSRLGRGAIAVGGLVRPLADGARAQASAELHEIGVAAEELLDHLQDRPSVVDRLRGTGVISPEVAESLALVGPVARASGLARDVRKDRPYGPYAGTEVRVAQETAGDVEARLQVKVREIVEAARLAGRFLQSRNAAPPTSVPTPPRGAMGRGFGLVESPRGEFLVAVTLAPGGQESPRLERVHVRDPSFLNWPAIEYAVRGNIVPDFPLCNKSLNLSYSGFDR